MTETSPATPTRRSARRLLVGGAVVAMVTVSAVGIGIAQDPGRRGERMGDFAAWRVERALEEVGATEEQRRAAREIVRGTGADLMRQAATMRETRREVRALLTAETIDRDAIEALRADRIAAIDAASRQAIDAIVEIAETLEPAQRAALADMMDQRRGEIDDRRGERRGPRGMWR